MAKTKISEFSSTPGNNTDIDSINIAEGCAPSGINDAIRELMAQLKDFQAGTAGDSFNGPVGTTTAAAGAFTTLTASSTATLNTLASSGATLTGGTINGMAIGGTTAAAVSATTLTTSSTVTLNGGTANGVAYLNGSKVLTTGSALTFDGTNLGVGGAAGNSTNYSTVTARGTSGGIYEFNAGGTLQSYILGNSSELRLQTQSTQAITFNPNGSEQMRLTSTGLELKGKLAAGYTDFSGIPTNGAAFSGSVGIGTSSPGARLTTRAAANSYTAGALQIESLSGTYKSYITNVGGLLLFSNSSTVDQLILDSSGNLGLGVTPSAQGATYRAINLSSSASYFSIAGQGAAACEGNLLWNARTTGSETFAYMNTGDLATRFKQSGEFSWYTAPSGTAGNAISFTQAMSLTAAGDFLVGTTSTTNNSRFACNNTAGTRKWGFGTQGSSTPFYVVDDTTGSGVQLTAGATSWSAFSDERIKTSVVPFANAIEKITRLRAGTGRYLTDAENVSRSFLIAQDVQKVLPEAVDVGEDENGTLTLRYTDLIPLITAAIQELKAEFDAYKAAHP